MKEKIENINKNIIKSKSNHPLDRCITTAHPEMARNNNDDEPCDDDRS